MSLNFYCNIQIVEPDFGAIMNSSIVPCITDSRCWWCQLGIILNAIAFLSIFTHHYTLGCVLSSDGCFQQDNKLCRTAQIISNCFFNMKVGSLYSDGLQNHQILI